jgi:hypothetical protein
MENKMKTKKLRRILYRPDCYAMLPKEAIIEVACLWMSECGDYALTYSPPKRGDSDLAGCGCLSVVKRSDKRGEENLYVDVDGENWSNIGDGDGYVCSDLSTILKKINKEKTAETVISFRRKRR